MNVLERHGVEAAYEHHAKTAAVGPSLALGDTLLKWYEIAPADDPIEPSLSDLARLGLVDACRLGELRLDGGLGFVVLHRCGDGFHFLLVATWQNANELWETVWAKDGDGDPEFHPWPLDGTAPPDVLRLGARRRRARAPRLDAVPPHAAGRRRAAGVPARRVRGGGVRRRAARGPPGAPRSTGPATGAPRSPRDWNT